MKEFILLLGPFCFLIIDIILYLGILILIEVFSYKEISYKNKIELIENREERYNGVIKK